MGGCKVIVVGGMQAGVGKSTVTVGLMAALRQRGLRVQGFKVGPDLLDPLLHEAATGKPSYNLDGWMLTKEHNLSVARSLAGDADVAVVEGGDGLYDGTFGDEDGSTGQLAKWLPSSSSSTATGYPRDRQPRSSRDTSPSTKSSQSRASS